MKLEVLGLDRHDLIKEWHDTKAARGWTGSTRWVELRLRQWSRCAMSSRWPELICENTMLENGSRIRAEILWRLDKLKKTRRFVQQSLNLTSARDIEIGPRVLRNERFRDFRDPSRAASLDRERQIFSTPTISSRSSLAVSMSTTSTPTSKACRPSATIDAKTSRPQTTPQKSRNLPSFCLKRTKVELCLSTLKTDRW